jgi:hypothetical protein
MKLLMLILSFSLALLLTGCGCDGEDPNVILRNNGTGKADIQVKTSNGNTENINNVMPGTTSERRTFIAGDIEFTINIQGVNDPVVYILQAGNCYDYTVTINADNSVTSSGDERD